MTETLLLINKFPFAKTLISCVLMKLSFNPMKDLGFVKYIIPITEVLSNCAVMLAGMITCGEANVWLIMLLLAEELLVLLVEVFVAVLLAVEVFAAVLLAVGVLAGADVDDELVSVVELVFDDELLAERFEDVLLLVDVLVEVTVCKFRLIPPERNLWFPPVPLLTMVTLDEVEVVDELFVKFPLLV